MKFLTENGDIVPPQDQDVLSVTSREGIYELARGIALRMAWNKPEAYEKMLENDLTFVGWKETEFATKYKIGWKAEYKSSPLMYGSVRTLIDSWFKEFMKQEARYEAPWMMFPLTCSEFDDWGSSGSEQAVNRGDFPSDYWIPGCLGWKGGANPFLPNRKADLKTDCGSSALKMALTMIGVKWEEKEDEERDLLDIVARNSSNYDFEKGTKSYERFTKNALALEDNWELGVAALIGMFDRCYWTMMNVNKEMIHPRMKSRYMIVNVEVKIEVEQVADGENVKYVAKKGEVIKNQSEETNDIEEDDDIVLERSFDTYGAMVSYVMRERYPAPESHRDTNGMGVVRSLTVDGKAMSLAYWTRTSGSTELVQEPTSSSAIAVSRRMVEVSLHEDVEGMKDHKSAATWLFERYDSDYEGGYHKGQVLPRYEKKGLKTVFDDYVKKLGTREPMKYWFAPMDISVGDVEEVEFNIGGDAGVVDLYDSGGNFIARISGIPPGTNPEDGGTYTSTQAGGQEYVDRVYTVPVPVFFSAGGENNDMKSRMDIKVCALGRNDIEL